MDTGRRCRVFEEFDGPQKQSTASQDPALSKEDVSGHVDNNNAAKLQGDPNIAETEKLRAELTEAKQVIADLKKKQNGACTCFRPSNPSCFSMRLNQLTNNCSLGRGERTCVPCSTRPIVLSCFAFVRSWY